MKLSKQERHALLLLSEGKTSHEICHAMGISQTTLLIYKNHLRIKTKILNLENREECTRVLTGIQIDYSPTGRPVGSMRATGLTERQRTILTLMAQGKPMVNIALQLGISKATVNVHACAGRLRLGMANPRDHETLRRLLGMDHPPTATEVTEDDPAFQ